LNVLILGGSGGIGDALVNALCGRDNIHTVHATFLNTPPTRQHNKLIWHKLDPCEDADVKDLLGQLGRLDWCINCIGMLHTQQSGPEKTLTRFDPDFFQKNMQINVLPSLLLAKYLPSNFKGVDRAIMATVSAKVGSIEDNRLGGWVSYRASKAALNMALKTIAIEWQRKLPNVAVASLHPGTTDTSLSKPFQNNVPIDKLFSPEKTAALLLAVLDKLTPAESGRFWSWDGTELPW